METAAQVLLIIVSSVLSVFLIVGIIVLVYMVILLKQLRRITDKAENITDSVESAAENIGKIASGATLLKLINNIVNFARTNGRKEQK